MSGSNRNAPCPCGSGRKYKVCCLRRDEAEETERRERDGGAGEDGGEEHREAARRRPLGHERVHGRDVEHRDVRIERLDRGAQGTGEGSGRRLSAREDSGSHAAFSAPHVRYPVAPGRRRHLQAVEDSRALQRRCDRSALCASAEKEAANVSVRPYCLTYNARRYSVVLT